jgi:hypothetical protein
MTYPSRPGIKMIAIDTEEDGNKVTSLILLDLPMQFNIASIKGMKESLENLAGPQLIMALRNFGAPFHDGQKENGEIVPAMQMHEGKTDKIVASRSWFLNRASDDPENPSVKEIFHRQQKAVVLTEGTLPPDLPPFLAKLERKDLTPFGLAGSN